MKKTEKAVLIEGLRKLSADVAWIADTLEGKAAPAPAEEPAAQPEQEAPAQEEKMITFEEARALLADKARAGYKAEVKAILTAHGVGKLSDITDPAELAKVAEEAKEVGNG